MKRWTVYANGSEYTEEPSGKKIKRAKISPKVRRWRRNGTKVEAETWFLARALGSRKLQLPPEHIEAEEVEE
jgi:hypothetical protein